MKTPTFKEFMNLDWDGIEPFYQVLQEMELGEGSLDSWMEGWSDLRKLVDERYARLELATELDTTDDRGRERTIMIFWRIFTQSIRAADQKLKRKTPGQ